VIAGIVVGGTLFSICVGFGAFGFFKHRKKHPPKAAGEEALTVELSP
jgi:hypothetical protein